MQGPAGGEILCLADLEAHAKEVLDRNAWGHYSGGANHEQTLRDNAEAFARYRIRPRVLQDVSSLDTRVQLYGEWVEFPICAAPTSLQKMAHPEGEGATARACANLGTCMTLSSWSTTSIEDVAQAGGPTGLRWFQLYVYSNREVTRDLIQRAERAGYKTVMVTVDTPIVGQKWADLRNNFSLPPHFHLGIFDDTKLGFVQDGRGGLYDELINPGLTWEDIAWVKSITKLPVLVKGVLTAEGALEAVQHGVQGVVVSNHGGRQLDGTPATIDALSEVVHAVGGRVDVFLDGGVRQGTDVLKALALGAKAVFVGRPVLWGLAYKGQQGVEEMLAILKEEFRHAMMLAGCVKISDIKPELIVHESFYKAPRNKL